MREDFSFSQMQQALQQPAAQPLQTLNLTILRNIVLEPIAIPVQYFARQAGFAANITFGEFDNIYQDSLDPQKITPATDAVLIVAPLYALSAKLSQSFCGLSESEKQQEQQHIEYLTDAVITNIRQLNPAAAIFFLDFEMPAQPAFGVHDKTMASGQSGFIAQLNQALAERLQQTNDGFMLDTGLLLRQIGAKAFYDWRYWQVGRALYSRETLIHIARLQQTYLNMLRGKSKKCLVLDCDNTLWGGIIGEDGLAGIQLGNDYPGACFRDFQRAVIELYHQGIILALCSKNNQADVLEVLRNHPDMLLKEQHIACHRINWDDKPSNIQAIAEQLNIDLDSLVFIDDSRFEIELVKQQLPTVESIWLDIKQQTTAAQYLRSLHCFDKLSLTAEDQQRGQMYQAQQLRQQHSDKTGHKSDQSTDLKGYLSSLALQLEVFLATGQHSPRIAQQTQKTNQFNLTTRRYSEDDITRFIHSDSHDVIGLKVTDRFGDMGIVGSAILHYQSPPDQSPPDQPPPDQQPPDQQTQALVDTFLLSCRALGRQIETAFLTEIIYFCQQQGIDSIIGRYIATGKNMQVKDFYQQHHFVVQNDNSADQISELPLRDHVCEQNPIFTIKHIDLQHER